MQTCGVSPLNGEGNQDGILASTPTSPEVGLCASGNHWGPDYQQAPNIRADYGQ